MLNITEKDKEFLLNNIDNIKPLIDGNDVRALLIEVSKYLDYVGFDENWNFTDEGRTVQAIYDRIYYNN